MLNRVVNPETGRLNTVSIPQNPIFIVGVGRSGTTLLQSMIATQKNIFAFPESQFFTDIGGIIRTCKENYIDPDCASQCLELMRVKFGIEFPKPVNESIIRTAAARELTKKMFFELVVIYYLGDEFDRHHTEPFRWIDKTPNNAFFLDEIYALYPEAQFINIVRNPIPVVYSRRQKLKHNHETSFLSLAKLWVNSLTAVETFKSKHPDKVHILQYENLVAAPEQTIADICAFLGVPFDSSLLNNYRQESEKVVRPHETHKFDVREKELKNTNNDYNPRLIDILIIQFVTQKKMKAYGYPIAYPRLQVVFSALMSALFVLGRLRFLSPLKPFGLNILKPVIG